MNPAAPKPQALSRLTKGYIICLIGTVLWSSAAVFIRYLTVNYSLPPLVLAFWRDLFVTLCLTGAIGLFSPSKLRVSRRDLVFLAFYGFILSIFNGTWTISVALNGAAVSTVLAYSSAGFTAIMGWRLFGEQLGTAKIIAVLLSMVGCAFVSGAFDPAAWSLNPIGIITGLFSGIAFAAYSLMGKASAQRKLFPWTVLLYAFGFAAIFLLSFNFLSIGHPLNQFDDQMLQLGASLAGWGVLLLLAIVPTMGGYGLYTVSLSFLPASVANLIATLEPTMTAALSFAFLNERFTAPQWIGSILIISGVVILRLYEGRGEDEALNLAPAG